MISSRFTKRKEVASELKHNRPQSLDYPFTNQLEAWKEDARVRSSARQGNRNDSENDKSAVRLKSLLQGETLSYGGVSDSGDTDAEGTRKGSHTQEQPPQPEVWKGRAWNSGTLLVRPGGEDRPSGRVPRTTYIYLVGTAARVRGLEVEVLVGEPGGGGGGGRRTILSRATGVMRACVPERKVYTVRNLSVEGKTAVLYWTAPNGNLDVWYAQPTQGALTDGSEEVKQEMLHALRRPPAKAIKSRVKTSAPAKNQPMVDRAYGRE
ncbi:unnamed protein product [Ectocarpus sp. CCAP 1310/34]|nr:unnamed protein product [Ectocarpus sp. CCAP 1310/34]